MSLLQLIKHMLQIETLKIYGAQTAAFLTTYTALDATLKSLLLLASIVYTVVKIWSIIKNNKG